MDATFCMYILALGLKTDLDLGFNKTISYFFNTVLDHTFQTSEDDTHPGLGLLSICSCLP